MRMFLPLICVLTLGLASGRGQESADPLPEKEQGTAGEIPADEVPDPLGQPLQLIPERDDSTLTPDYGDPAELAAEAARIRERMRVPSETQISAEAHKQKVAMRQARIRAEKEPAVREAWDQAEAAPTDAERRYALRLYYNRLYDRMLKINSALSGPIEESRSESLGDLKQTRIRPSVWTPETAGQSR